MPPTLTAAGSARSLRLVYAVTFCQFVGIGMFLTGIQLFVKDELGSSKAAVGLAVGAFSITAVLSRPVVGRGIDVRGRKPFLYLGLVLLVVSSLGFLFAHSVVAVIGLRLVQGVNGACVYTCVAAMATDLAPLDKRASAIAHSLRTAKLRRRPPTCLAHSSACAPAESDPMLRPRRFVPQT